MSLRTRYQFLSNFKLLILIFGFSLTASAITNSMIAIVNDDVITFDTIAKQIGPASTKAQKIALINQQIDLVLLLKEVQKLGVQPKAKTINLMLSRIATQNKLSLAQLKASPEFDAIVKNITQELSLRGLKKFVLNTIEVNLTPAEINAAIANDQTKISDFSKEIKIAQILINSIDKTNANTLAQSKDTLIKQFLIELTDKINTGTSFDELAKLHSQDSSYQNGGESGWFGLEKSPPVIQKQLQGLELGQISKPFFTPQGWRIIKIIKQRDAAASRLDAIKSQLIQSQKNTYYQDWVKKLREGVYIEIFANKL